jgi:hypothetical protein
MKTRSIHVNKTKQNPNGVELELIVAETKLEERMLKFFLGNLLRFMQDRGTLAVTIPDNFFLEYKEGGSFIVCESPKAQTEGGNYYQQARPHAVVGLRKSGKSFDLVYREVPASELQTVPRSEVASHDANNPKLEAAAVNVTENADADDKD